MAFPVLRALMRATEGPEEGGWAKKEEEEKEEEEEEAAAEVVGIGLVTLGGQEEVVMPCEDWRVM